MDDIALKVENVSKDFLLPHEKISSLKGIFTNLAKGKSRKTKETQHALRDISFSVKKGEFFGIVGRNGSGKSTLLKILAGIYQPTQGIVHATGKLVPFIELGVGFNPELTGRENVFLNGAMLGFSQKEIKAMYEDIVDFAELERFMDQKLKNYSSGMQVRLAFSLATRSQADILLIDEVLAVGDADFQRKCFNYFSQLKSTKTTVVFISHDMSAIREYCDRAMLIEDNRIVEISSADEVAQKYIRLFMKEATLTQSETETQKGDRWGDQAINIQNVQVSIEDGNINIAVDIKCNKNFKRPIAGFRIRDAAGHELTGTNTKIESNELPNLTKGQKLKVNWQLPNILSEGEYNIDVALQYPDEITISDWWDGAAKLVVNREKGHIPYNIDPGFITTIG